MWWILPLILPALAFSLPETSTSSYQHASTLRRVFSTHLTSSHLIPALKHEENLQLNSNKHDLSLICSPYEFSSQLQSLLLKSSNSNEFHPIFHSKKSDQSCSLISQQYLNLLTVDEKISMKITSTHIPHILKLHQSTTHLLSNKQQEEKLINRPMTIELAYGLGVGGKGSHSQSIQQYSIQLLHTASQILSNKNLLTNHWNNFYWTTSSKKIQLIQKNLSPEDDHMNGNEELSMMSSKYSHLVAWTSDEISTSRCNFNLLHIETSKSHILYTSHGNSHSKSREINYQPECLSFLMTVAALQSEISFISVTYGESIDAIVGRTNAPYEDADPATDQNSWVQSGTSTETPYSDIGIDGTGYLLGMIDTGLDDLSCFLIDTSGEQTTRTPRSNYTNPITEMYRRKVVQYIAWADGEPSIEYDHGTWCAGASLGNCINTTSTASAYNGVASNAKISIFDVDVSSTENYLNVPSLYNVALPIAYNVGARVHSNSWTTYYMSSYTSKSIDVDEFTYENPDFLFIAGAGNSGDTGYNSVTAPANSKNGIAVGASSVDHNNLVYFSSLGSSYDTAFKPNIVTPGRYLQSAGVHMSNETTSCNVEISSGTSMATPIAAGSAILIRHYLENSTYWGKFCNSEYKSCPIIVPSKTNPTTSDFISSALLRAVIIHSGSPMNKYESSTSNMLPETNLTSPPNNYEGWGQLRLSNVLPLPNKYNFDLYVSDYVTIQSLTRHTYYATVTDASTPLRVTIAWVDPPNINWAVKNLLNDLDLIVILPTGTLLYGNSLIGDEYNTQERVVLDLPLIGEYKIFVQSKIFPIQDQSQKYSIVITSKGSVNEKKFKTETITLKDIQTINSCEDETELIQFQLEDWYAGETFQNNSITLEIIDVKTSLLHSQCEFLSNELQNKAEFTRTSQCSVCLHKKTQYLTQLRDSENENEVQNIPRVIRGVSPQCNIYLSTYATSSPLVVSGNGACNSCSSGGYITINMYANVTDDDESQYSWYGLASYSIQYQDQSTFASGTLTISDEEADRYCINKGTYILSFNDTLLYSSYRKHGEVVFTLPDGSTVSFEKSGSVTIKVTIPDTNNEDNDDDHGLSQSALIGISIGGAVLGVAIIGGLLFAFLRKDDPEGGETYFLQEK